MWSGKELIINYSEIAGILGTIEPKDNNSISASEKLQINIPQVVT